ncbi:MAG: CPBP family intramembrane metalloprotease [Rhodobacteraceae bacterium]|nr:CPBP family intramembrane metalloprotease [Paracoccaceae bacterium]
MEDRKAAFEAYLAAGRDGVGWWRFLAGVALLGVLYFIAPILAAAAGFALYAAACCFDEVTGWVNAGADLEAAPFGVTATFLIAVLIGIAASIPVLAGISRGLHRRSMATMLGGRERWVGRNLLCGAAAAVAASLITITLALAIGLIGLTPTERPPSWPIIAAALAGLIIFQAAAEELVFRGYFLQWIGARVGNALAWAAGPSVVFALLHFSGDSGIASLGYVAATFVFGLFAAATVRLTGGLSCAVGYHIANNWIALLLVNTPVGVQGAGLYRIEISPERLPLLMGLGLLFLPAIYAALTVLTVAETPKPIADAAAPEPSL